MGMIKGMIVILILIVIVKAGSDLPLPEVARNKRDMQNENALDQWVDEDDDDNDSPLPRMRLYRKTLPKIRSLDIGPNVRLSQLFPRLSPMTKNWFRARQYSSSGFSA